MKKRLFKRRWVRIVTLLVVLWIAVAAVLVGWGVWDAREGRANLAAAQASASGEALRSGQFERNLAAASANLGSANDKLSNPIVQPFRIIPLAGRQLTSAIRLTDAAAEASAVGSDAVGQVREIDASKTGDRAAMLREVATVARDGSRRLAGVDLGPESRLLPPLADARSEGEGQIRTITQGLVRGAAASEGFAGLLSTDSDYLLLAGNNAEMRNGSGMFLQAGLLQTGGGQLEVGDMQTVANVQAPEEAIVWPADLENAWGWLGKKGDLRDLMLSPDFSVSAPIAKQIWEQEGRPQVDGVVVVDIPLMQALLAITGPVTVDGTTFTKDNVNQQLLLDQYQGVQGNLEANTERRENLADVAGAAFAEFATGNWDVATAARELGGAAEGRHMFIWSTDPAINDNWVSARMNGTISANETMLGLVNLGTNKLDQFMNVDVELETVKTNDITENVMSVTIKNEAPLTAPEYVLGGFASPDAIPQGTYNGMLSLTLPADATDVRFDKRLPLSVAGRTGLSQIIATGINVPRGNEQTFVVRFNRPDTARGTVAVPSARVPAVEWTHRDETWQDTTRHEITY